jgi:hypothetical protein
MEGPPDLEDAGSTATDGGAPGYIPTDLEADAGSDGGTLTDADAGALDADGGVPTLSPEPQDPVGEALENIAELTTCKPSQINPMVDCVTMTCEDPDPLVAAGCMVEMCGPLASAIDSRCGDCLMAAISQDPLGLLSCVDGEAVLGTP